MADYESFYSTIFRKDAPYIKLLVTLFDLLLLKNDAVFDNCHIEDSGILKKKSADFIQVLQNMSQTEGEAIEVREKSDFYLSLLNKKFKNQNLSHHQDHVYYLFSDNLKFARPQLRVLLDKMRLNNEVPKISLASTNFTQPVSTFKL